MTIQSQCCDTQIFKPKVYMHLHFGLIHNPKSEKNLRQELHKQTKNFVEGLKAPNVQGEKDSQICNNKNIPYFRLRHQAVKEKNVSTYVCLTWHEV